VVPPPGKEGLPRGQHRQTQSDITPPDRLSEASKGMFSQNPPYITAISGLTISKITFLNALIPSDRLFTIYRAVLMGMVI